MPVHRRGPWSAQEDRYLRDLINANGAFNWVKISQLIQARSPKQCRERWHQNLKPSLNHEPITPQEGKIIERLVKEMGKRWAEIARQLPNRSDNAVKNWWNGGQNRRRRDHQRRSDGRAQDSIPYPPQQPANPYAQHTLPSSLHYHGNHVPSTLPPLAAPSHQIPMHQQYRPNIFQHPQPLDIDPITQRPRHFDTPIPSPSGVSECAPSLMTDDGSEGRSPHPAGSPHSLPPLIGTRVERRRSSLACLPPPGGFVEHDEPQHLIQIGSHRPEEPKRVSSRLGGYYPSPAPPSPHAPLFQEPNYSQAPSLMLQEPRRLPSPQHVSPSMSQQRQLPPFESLAQPGMVPKPRATEQNHFTYPSPPLPARPSSATKDQRMDMSRMLS